MSILGKVIKSAIIEKASIDEVYLDVTEEATRRLNAIQNDVAAFNAIIALARASSLAGEDAVEMKMSKNALRKGHSGTKKDDEAELEGPNVRDWFEQPHYMWNHDDKLLLCGAIICDELRSEVLKQINYSCSGGVAHNKMLSKIASAMHKPNRQTLVPSCAVQNLMHCLPINRVAGFGGKLGDSLSDFGGRKLEKFSDLIEVGKSELSAAFGEETTIWMLNAASGIDHTPVEQRALTASIGCGKSYRQKNTLPPIALQDGRVLHWLRELSEELEERVQMDTDMHSRKPKQITVGLSIAYVIPPKPPGDTADPVKKWHEGQGMSLSKVGPMCAGAVAISKAAHAMAVRAVADSTRLNKPWNITYISLSASGFVPVANESRSISSFFKTAPSPIKKSKSNPSSPYDTNTVMLLKEIKEKEEKNEKEEKEIQHEINEKNLLSSNITAIPPSDDSVTAVLLQECSFHLFDRKSDTIEHGLETVKTVNSTTEMKPDSVSGISTHGAKNVPQDFYGGNDDDCDEYMHDEISDSIKEISSYYTDKSIIKKKNIKNDYINDNSDNLDSKNGSNNDISNNNNNFNESYDVFGNNIGKNKIINSRNNKINDDTNQSNYNDCKIIQNINDNLINNINDITKLSDKKDISDYNDTYNKSDNDSIHKKTPSNILHHELLTGSFNTSIIQPFDTINHNNNNNSIDNDLFRGRIISVDCKISRNLHDNQQEKTVCGMESVANDVDDSDDVIVVENNDENSSDHNEMYDYNDYNNDSNDSNLHNINTDNNTTNFVKSSSHGVSNIYHNDCNDDDTIDSKGNDENNNNNHDNINHNINHNDNHSDNNNSNNNNNNNLINNSNEHNPFNNSSTISHIDIDMDVFYSLPLDLQKELSIAMNIPNVLNGKESKNINRVSISKSQKNKVNLNNSKNKINTATLPKSSSQLSSYFCNPGKCTNQDKDKDDVIMIEDDENDNEDDNHSSDTNIDILLPSSIR